LFFLLVLHYDLVLWNFPLRTSFWDPFTFHSHNTTHTSYIIHNI
jgi:hypothetical protein